MYLFLALIAVVLLFIYLVGSTARTVRQRFQESCQLTTLSTLPPSHVKELVDNTLEQINAEVARHIEPIKVGMVTVKGIEKARLTSVTLGDGSAILPCTSSCVCKKSTFFPQGSAIHLSNATATVLAPDMQISFLGGLGKMKTTVEARVTGVNAVIETDCGRSIVVTSIDLDKVEFLQPSPDTMVGKWLAKLPKQREQLLEGLNSFVIGKVFSLPSTLSDLPLLCKKV